MRRWFLWLLMLSAGCLTSDTQTSAAQNIGMAYFALPSKNFPCTDALAAFDDNSAPSLAILYGTFGSETSCLSQWFAKLGDRPHLLEIHLSNEACRRNKRCGSNEFEPSLSVRDLNKRLKDKDPALLKEISTRVAEIKNIIAPLAKSNGEYILSTGLEDNYSTEAYSIVLETVRAAWPYKIARSPVGNPITSERLSADYLEGHGANPDFSPGTPCIANLDGQDMVFPHRSAITRNRVDWTGVLSYLDKYKSQCRAVFLWSAPWQGITSDAFQPPSQRTFSITKQDVSACKNLIAKGATVR